MMADRFDVGLGPQVAANLTKAEREQIRQAVKLLLDRMKVFGLCYVREVVPALDCADEFTEWTDK